MKRLKFLFGVICAVLCVLVVFTMSVCAVDGENVTPIDTTAETTAPTVVTEDKSVTNTAPDSNTLEGVCYTFLTFFFSAATVAAYGEFFGKLAILLVMFIVSWIFRSVFGLFKKRR